MVSINTGNTGIATAALRNINSQLTITQNRIATGFKVNSAADNASAWAAATKIRSDKAGSEAIKSGALAARDQANAALAGLDEVSKLLSSVRDVAVASNGAATASDVAKINGYISAAQAIINGSSVGGKNLLTMATSASVTAQLNVAEGVGTGMSLTASGLAMLDSATVAYKDVFKTQTDTLVNAASNAFVGFIDAAQTAIGNSSATLGAFVNGVDSGMSFLDKLNDIRDTAIGSLVDADLEKESAKLNALQVKQQLAYSALSVANQSNQNILRLFQ